MLALARVAVPLLGLVLFAVHGLRVTPDSVSYLAMARSIADGWSLVDWNGEPAGIWPPGYSLLLVPWIAAGVGPVVAGWAVAAVGYLGYCFVAWKLVAREFDAAGLRLGVWVLLCLGSPLPASFPALLSDGVFLLGIVAFLYLLRRPGALALAGLILVAAAMPMVRYIGIIVPVWLVVDALGRSWRQVAIRCAAFLPFALLVSRNLQVFGELAPALAGEPRPLAVSLRRASEVALRWFVPQVDSTDVLRITAVVLVVVLVILLRRAGVGSAELRRALERSRPVLGLGALYLAMYWWATATRLLDLPNDRLLAPVYVLAVIGLALLVAELWPRLAARTSVRWWRFAGLAVVLYGVGHSVSSTVHLRPWVVGADYHSTVRGDAVRAAVESAGASTLLYSNGADRIYWFTGRQAAWVRCDAPQPSPLAGAYLDFPKFDPPFICRPDSAQMVEIGQFPWERADAELVVYQLSPD